MSTDGTARTYSTVRLAQTGVLGPALPGTTEVLSICTKNAYFCLPLVVSYTPCVLQNEEFKMFCLAFCVCSLLPSEVFSLVSQMPGALPQTDAGILLKNPVATEEVRGIAALS